jgi:hypothetical protein
MLDCPAFLQIDPDVARNLLYPLRQCQLKPTQGLPRRFIREPARSVIF